MAIIDGTKNDDVFDGTPLADELDGKAGDDTMKGLAGDDLMIGNGGDDTLFGNEGEDEIYGDLPGGGIIDDLDPGSLVGEGTSHKYIVTEDGVRISEERGDADKPVQGGRATAELEGGDVLSVTPGDGELVNVHGGEGLGVYTPGEQSNTGNKTLDSDESLLIEIGPDAAQNAAQSVDLTLRSLGDGEEATVKLLLDGEEVDTVTLEGDSANTLNTYNISVGADEAFDALEISGVGDSQFFFKKAEFETVNIIQPGDDTIDAGEGHDFADGGAGNDTIAGGLGDDEIHGGDGDDLLRGDLNNSSSQTGQGGGDDDIFGGKGDDRIGGKDGNDYIDGGLDEDSVWGDAGDDTIVGGDDDDHLRGNDGNDVIYGDSGPDGEPGDVGFDISGNHHIYYASDPDGDGLSLDASHPNDNESFAREKVGEKDGQKFVATNEEADFGDEGITISAEAQDGSEAALDIGRHHVGVVSGGEDLDARLRGDTEDGEALVVNLEAHAISGTIHLTDFDRGDRGQAGENAVFQGYDGDKLIGEVVVDSSDLYDYNADKGTGFVDVSFIDDQGNPIPFDKLKIIGGADEGPTPEKAAFSVSDARFDSVAKGDDILEGGKGNDELHGGYGDDTLTGDQGNDTINGDEGLNDTVDYLKETGSDGVDVNLETGEATDTHGDEDTLSGVENVIGTDEDDNITGNWEKNELTGNDGDDTLIGGGNNDKISGGEGDDTIYGDGVDQQLIENGSFDDVGGQSFNRGSWGTFEEIPGWEPGGENQVLEIQKQSHGGTPEGDNFAELATDNGDKDPTISLKQTVTSETGGTYVLQFDWSAREGRDTEGNSKFDVVVNGEVVGSYTDTEKGWHQQEIHIDLNAGDNTVEFVSQADDPNTTVGALIDNVSLEPKFGGHDKITAGDGEDTVYGGGGNDKIDGGAGDDDLFGNAGNDTFKNLRADGEDGNGNDVIDGGSGSDTVDYRKETQNLEIALGEGRDEAVTNTGDTLIDIENVKGGKGDDTLTGNSEDNTLSGGKGDDTLNGGEGNDVLKGGKGDNTLNGGDGVDTADFSGAKGGLNIILDDSGGGSFDNGRGGTDTLSSIENLKGGKGDDVLGGNTGDNKLSGGNGDDWLFGDLKSIPDADLVEVPGDPVSAAIEELTGDNPPTASIIDTDFSGGGIRLTSLGYAETDGGDFTVWRVRNESDTDATGLTLQGGGNTSDSFDVPAGDTAIVLGSYSESSSNTHKVLDSGGNQLQVKASSNQLREVEPGSSQYEIDFGEDGATGFFFETSAGSSGNWTAVDGDGNEIASGAFGGEDGQKVQQFAGDLGGKVAAKVIVDPGEGSFAVSSGGFIPNNGVGGDDVLKGGKGDDHLFGGGGADRLSGGKGDDTFEFDINDFFDAEGEEITHTKVNKKGKEKEISTYDGGKGFDTIDATGFNGGDGGPNTLDFSGKGIKGVEAIIGNGEDSLNVKVSLNEIAKESDSDGKNNKKVDDPFDDSFLAIGINSLDFADEGWTFGGSVAKPAGADEFLEDKLEGHLDKVAGVDGVDDVFAYVFMKGSREVIIYTDLSPEELGGLAV